MITPPLKTHISSRARYLSSADYKDIMQYRDMKSKPLAQLSKKYNISNSRLYQIWRGQEFNRIQWNDLAVTSSMNVINKQNEEHQAERDFQNKFNTAFTALENKIHDAEISKSTDPVSEESASSKAKKTEGKKQFQGGQSIPGTKKEIISPTDPSEDVLDLYKRTNNTLEKIKASGRPLISK
ncbi:hypothetical protein RhiirA1_475112 [Rhizophagus irregularis]|uniref:Uncharacterized protein n=2 Tax=Rhizophagus irregularis TaxID=588596 RepID=A0A2I1FIK3_9GLOM|nr:hypothetical protein RhiirA1_475112 [Rhizophagus irregularis]PKY34189.1 hypothetical protein RhiirB3_395364 [Rhizophagus irregularis]